MSESAIFKAAVKLSPDRRAAYLDQACVANADVRREVESLLRPHDASSSFLKNEPCNSPLTGDYDPITEGPGTTVGPYKLMEQIGEGGFGLVFVAEQQHPVRRKVALKIIKPGLDTREVIARFEAERQALALMDHPNIARVLDAGATESGRPFFVMELVKGIPINEYCDQQQLNTRERLQLFLSVCQAVQHAHTKGIIHRDLKPSNILVAPHDGVPVVKVIDFGVAKAIGQQLTEKTIYTRFTQMIGTPLYMSPEQAEVNQLDVDIRSDVYSLGVLLYELLTGTTPFDRTRFATAAYDEIRRIIKEEEPPKPSTRLTTMGESINKVSSQRKTEPAKLSALVKGDLDWIVMKALEKDRTRRYETATTFAADVRRFLGEEPIEARPPSALYRLRKLTRRNRALLTTAGMIAAALFIGLGLTTWQAVRATNAERMAIADRDEKEQARLAEAEHRSIAVAAQQKAQQERDRANAARDALRGSHYAASMNLINTAWGADNVVRVLELLEENRPKPGEADIRGFEWHYWDRLCHAERRLWTMDFGGGVGGVGDDGGGPGGGPVGGSSTFQASGDGRRLVYWKFVRDSQKVRELVFHVIDVANGSEITSFKVPKKDSINPGINFVVNRDGSRILFQAFSYGGGPDNGDPLLTSPVIVLDVASGQTIFSKEENADRGILTLSADGKHLAITQNAPPPKSGGVGPGGRFFGSPRWEKISIWDVAKPEQPPVVIANSVTEYIHLPPIFSPDGSRLLAVANDNPFNGAANRATHTIRIWDAATGKSRISQTFEEDAIQSVTFSQDGTRLAALGTKISSSGQFVPASQRNNNLYATILDGATGSELTARPSVLAMASNSLSNVSGRIAFSPDPDGRQVAMSNLGLPTVVLDVARGEITQRIKTATMIHSLAFSADGARLLTTGYGRRAGPRSNIVCQEWDVVPVASEKPATEPVPRIVVVTSENGERQASYAPRLGNNADPPDENEAREITIRDRGGKVVHVFKGHTRPVSRLNFTPDGRWVLSRSGPASDVEAKLWNADTGEVRWSHQVSIPANSDSPMSAVRFSPDGRWIVLREGDGLKVATVPDLVERFKLGPASITTFSPDSRRMTSIYRPDNNFQAVPPPEQRLGNVKLWDLEAGREIKTLRTSNSFLAAITFSPDSRLLALSDISQVIIFDAATGEQRSIVKSGTRNGGGTGFNNGRAAFSPDGTRIVLVDRGQAGGGGMPAIPTTVYDVATGNQLFRLEGHSAPILTVTYSPDGTRIATAATSPQSRKAEVKLWDAASGRELLTLASPRDFNTQNALIFSPDGHTLTLRFTAAQAPGGINAQIPRSSDVIWDATPRPEKR